MWAYRWRFCKTCGKPIRGRFPPAGDIFCLEHRMDRARDAALQLASKSGPFYDRWLETRGPQGRPRND